MLGGRRCGKSSILASITKTLREEVPGNICVFADNTPYETLKIPSLVNKQRELAAFIQRRKTTNIDCEFLVDMSPNITDATYTLSVNLHHGQSVSLEFTDVPGEWMRQNSEYYPALVEQIKDSDVYVIAIDTPYLMCGDDLVNDVANRVSEIQDALINKIVFNDDERHHVLDRKLIIFCPVKSEKWFKSGQIGSVVSRIEHVYKNLINKFAADNHVEMWCIPIQTAGGIVFSTMRPGCLLFRGEKDKLGESCSIDNDTNMVLLRDGKSIYLTSRPDWWTEEDADRIISGTHIPMSWYKCDGSEYSPVFTEQPAYHILAFIVNKEKEVVARIPLVLIDIIKKILHGDFTFGRHLKDYENLIKELHDARLIKYEKNGITKFDSVLS